LVKYLNLHKAFSGKAVLGHAITARSAAVQPSVISNSIKEMRDVRYHNASFDRDRNDAGWADSQTSEAAT
jgi:hypothetical protein